MAVPATMADLSTSEASNSPADSDSITATTRPSDYLRAHAAILRTLAASDTIASATTTDIGAKANTFLSVSGTTTITGLGTIAAGIYKVLIFEGALTFTHNAASLILPGGADITTAAGDVAFMLSLGSGNWRCLNYMKASGGTINANLSAISALAVTDGNIIVGNGTTWVAESGATARTSLGIIAATDSAAGLVELATQAEAEAGSADNVVMTPLKTAQAIQAMGLAAATAQNSTSGVAVDFVSIPSTAKRITIMFSSVSTSGTSIPLVQIGGSGGPETTGYVGGSSLGQNSQNWIVSNYTTGFALTPAILAAQVLSGCIELNKIDGNTWVANGTIYQSTPVIYMTVVAGEKTLSATLDRIRITTLGGADTFDAGTINIFVE